MICRSLLTAVVLSGSVALAGTAFAQGAMRGFDYAACEAAVIEKLGQHGVAEADIEDMGYLMQHSGARGGFTNMIGVEYWVTVKDRDGRAVVELTEDCEVTGAFTRRGLRLDGLRCFGRGC